MKEEERGREDDEGQKGWRRKSDEKEIKRRTRWRKGDDFIRDTRNGGKEDKEVRDRRDERGKAGDEDMRDRRGEGGKDEDEMMMERQDKPGKDED